MTISYNPPSRDCPLCPRLAGFRTENRASYPAYFNGPVLSFGGLDAQLLIVGLAPGLKGANQTGRPFTGDYAGLVLYSALEKFGFAHGTYEPAALAADHRDIAEKSLAAENAGARYADGFHLANCRITNAVRCVPPQNKPELSEIRSCNRFLATEIAAMPNLKVIMTLGSIAHKAVIMASGLRQSAFAFGHGNQHAVTVEGRRLTLINSYHCSRYNINTGVLTQEMFDAAIAVARTMLAL